MSKPARFLEIGRIVKTHGLKGRLKAVSYLESEDLLPMLTEIIIEQESEEKKTFPLREIRVQQKDSFLLRLEGVEDIDKATSLVGGRIFVPFDQWEKLPEGEYYWEEILGLTAVTEEGQILGRITRIFPTGSNDVYVCSGGEREILLPAIADVILKVDVEGRSMVVRLLEGL